MLSLVRLVDHKGGTFNQRGLLERPSVVHFGFTNCPAICPTTLSEMSSRMEDLGALADEINFIFVTVDPERDTPAVLGNYLSAFDPRIIGLTGEAAEIKALAESLGVTFARSPLDGGNYTMDHAVHAVLLDATGRKTGVLYMGGDSRGAMTKSW